MTRNDYISLFNSCVLTTEPTKILELKKICKIALMNQSSYEIVSQATSVPWPLIAGIHYRESSQDFTTHLHNGDPLTHRTMHVPANRPIEGNPPFTWSESAIDALKGVWQPFTWGVGDCLEFCERYNGLGYQKHSLQSPYVWSFTDKYTNGLFVADGTLDFDRKDSRPGIAAILKIFAQLGVSLGFKTNSAPRPMLH